MLRNMTSPAFAHSFKRFARLAVASLALAGLAACGGGGSSTPAETTPTTPTPTPAPPEMMIMPTDPQPTPSPGTPVLACLTSAGIGGRSCIEWRSGDESVPEDCPAGILGRTVEPVSQCPRASEEYPTVVECRQDDFGGLAFDRSTLYLPVA